jgi:hypothetical protein
MNAANSPPRLAATSTIRHRFLPSIAISMAVLFLATSAFGRDPREDGRIAALIAAMESLEGARFIRNGSEYDAKAAADHLRLKLGKAGEQVKTAEEFIEGCASRSSITGQKYRIRRADGTEMDSGDFLRSKLKEIDAPKQVPAQ